MKMRTGFLMHIFRNYFYASTIWQTFRETETRRKKKYFCDGERVRERESSSRIRVNFTFMKKVGKKTRFFPNEKNNSGFKEGEANIFKNDLLCRNDSGSFTCKDAMRMLLLRFLAKLNANWFGLFEGKHLSYFNDWKFTWIVQDRAFRLLN